MKDFKFPNSIKKHLVGMGFSENNIGCSNATVYKLYNETEEFFLKIERSNLESQQENKMIQWLQNRLQVPQIIHQCSYKGYDYLLMKKVDGEMSCSEKSLREPKKVVEALADGINKIQSVSIIDCPFTNAVDNKLEEALRRIENNEIDMSDWEKNTDFTSPEELYEYLVKNKPTKELVFSHGDYCLSNVYITDGEMTGLIDLGRSGIADKWQDIALCVRSLEHKLKSKSYTSLLFNYLNVEPNYEKINYYILLDELF